ncbi:MAG: hypothetical protein IJM25_08375 [Eubacterium sp.]|nr:hypothetical protein [Eubacterium sp.]
MKKKITLVLAAVCVCASLTACGGSSDSTSAPGTEAAPATETVTEAATSAPASGITIASTETWGDITVGIPDGWKFRKGDAFDENDTRYCSVKKSDFSYFDIKMETEDVMKKQYEYNKNTYTNEQIDVSGKVGEIDWTGFQYSDGWGGYGFELYATASGKPVRVSGCGFKFDSPEAKAVLESLKIK